MEESKNGNEEIVQNELEEKGYTLSDFLIYSRTKGQAGSDYQNWDIQILKKLIHDFIEEKEHALTNSQPSLQEEDKKEELIEEIQTLPLDNKGFGNDKVSCNITGYRIIDPGIFQSVYVVYSIVVEPNGISLERRFNDFFDFRLELVRLYPGYIIPAIPKKKVGKATNTDFIENRKRILQYFLNELMTHPVLGASRLTKDFLTLGTREWGEALKMSKKQPPPKSAQECRTHLGKARVGITPDLKQYCGTLQSELKSVQEYYHSLKHVGKSLSAEFEKISSSMVNGSWVCAKLQEIYSSLHKEEAMDIFAGLGRAFNAMNTQYTKMQKAYAENLWKFMMLYISELNALLEVELYSLAAEEQMTAYCLKLKKRKDQLFDSKAAAKWELNLAEAPPLEELLKNRELAQKYMLPRESAEELRQKQIHGYYSNKLREEFDRITHKNTLALVEHFKTVAANQNEVSVVLTEIWDGLREDMEKILHRLN